LKKKIFPQKDDNPLILLSQGFLPLSINPFFKLSLSMFELNIPSISQSIMQLTQLNGHLGEQLITAVGKQAS